MEREESIIDAILNEDNLDDDSQAELGQNIGGDVDAIKANQDSGSNNSKSRNKKKKKKNRRKKGSSGPDVIDINRFVLNVCKRLKERKTYLVYTAVGCLGVSALNDLVKEVEAVQACGGQKTADGRRFRTGGGILWSVLKTRDPDAYKEIMKKGKEFEKQFRQQNIRQGRVQTKQTSIGGKDHMSMASLQRLDQANTGNTSDGSHVATLVPNPIEQCNAKEKQIPVHDRIRVPVSYDDLLGDEDQEEKST
ncbi:hypothetical protein NMG60_11000796 [Bertholletia excelsa]